MGRQLRTLSETRLTRRTSVLPTTESGPGSGGPKMHQSFNELTVKAITEPILNDLFPRFSVQPSTHGRHFDIARSGWSRFRTGSFLSVLVRMLAEDWKGCRWSSSSARGRQRDQGGKRMGGRRRTSRCGRRTRGGSGEEERRPRGFKGRPPRIIKGFWN